MSSCWIRIAFRKPEILHLNATWTCTATTMSSSGVNLSGSWSRTSTPARAIVNTTALAARTAPSIPPASRSYEPLVKSVLRHRLTHSIFLYSAFLSWGLTVAWMHWNGPLGIGGSLLIPIMPATIFWTCIAWATGALPVLVLRKVCLTGEVISFSDSIHLWHGEVWFDHACVQLGCP
jgi:hypothetical protein